MNAFLEQITVIVLLIVIFMIVCYVMGYNVSSLLLKVQKNISPSKLKKEGRTEKESTRYEKRPTVFYKPGDRTKIYEKKLPALILEEWHSQELISRFLVKNYPKEGLVIGCMPSDTRMVKISGNDYIGSEHVKLIKKNGDLFITDNNSKNGLFNADKNRVKELKVDFCDITCCYLANPDLNVQLRVYRAPQDVEGSNDYSASHKFAQKLV